MNFEAKNIPYELLEKIGLKKKDVLSWSPDELKALLSGRTTQLKTISDGVGNHLQAKLSLYPESDGSLGVKVHPVRTKVEVPTNLNREQAKDLKEGKTVVANQLSKNGTKEPYMYKVDPETNEVFRTRIGNINLPRYLEGVELTQDQKAALLKGKEIELVKPDGKVEKIAINIIAPNGYSRTPLNYQESQKDQMSKAEKNEAEGVDISAKKTEKEGNDISLKKEIKDKVKAGLIAGPLGMAVDETIKQVKGRKR
ncbi:DUF3945 domain-containing protein [Chondrinema litorale]|uniref:DUF3945 domain-containing protein n=1 Tax=Chondrinema litorale TaxID=2994555 RepID=UPI002543BB6F|nr:DUF4099 domain-containing protein [Chondrinema litorale]UZS00026.1 DUF3945 domain-containing protein [Chondrinema litorale]